MRALPVCNKCWICRFRLVGICGFPSLPMTKIYSGMPDASFLSMVPCSVADANGAPASVVSLCMAVILFS